MNLKVMSAKELVAVHNKRCRLDQCIGGTWKRSKQELIAQIEALGNDKIGDVQPETAEFAEPADRITISQTLHQLLTETDLTHGQIVERVRAQFPEANTTARSVASVACVARRKGVDVPMRKRAKSD